MAKSTKPLKTSLWRPAQPFNQLPTLPPSAELETKAVLKQCIQARVALAELNRAAELIPNPSVLINTLPLLEAQASSAIENVITTTDRLFQFQSMDDQADPATKEALRHSHALLQGYQIIRKRPLTTRLAGEVCGLVKGRDMQVRRIPGTALVQGDTTVYTPPAGEDLLRSLLGNWERFLNEDSELDPLVRMAVAHYQFEAIHPFLDGNGRTGRILNSLYLIQTGLLKLPILYLSRHIIRHKGDYYRLLLEVTKKQAWESWVSFVLAGVEETARWTTAKIEAVRALQLHTADHVRRHAPKLYVHDLLSLIFELPYCRIRNVTARGIAGRQTASVYLKGLMDAGVLQEKVVGREKIFTHPKLLRLLTSEPNHFAPYT